MDNSHLVRILDVTRTGYMLLDAGGKVLSLNHTASALLGIGEGSAPGQSYQSILLHFDSPALAIALIQRSLRTGQPFFDEKVFRRTGEGGLNAIECSGFRVNDSDDMSPVVVTFRDVSRQIDIEEKLKDAIQDQLIHEQKLRQALHDLQALNEQLRAAQDQLIQAEKMRSVGHLAAGVAHEVKNPLAILLQGIEYLSRYSESRDDDFKSVLADMTDAVHRADAVIKQLLDFASPGDLEMKDEDVHRVLDDSLNLVKHLLASRTIHVEKKYETLVPPLKLDRNGIQQVFINLLSNAIFAMPEGGNLTISTGVGYKEDSGKVVITIEDTGSGVPEEILARLFEPFVTSRRGKGGTGLGLAVTRSIVEKHGGEIMISNRPQGGARAIVVL